MKKTRSLACGTLLGLLALVLAAAAPQRSNASGDMGLRAKIDPIGTAQSKIYQAQHLLLTQHPLDMG